MSPAPNANDNADPCDHHQQQHQHPTFNSTDLTTPYKRGKKNTSSTFAADGGTPETMAESPDSDAMRKNSNDANTNTSTPKSTASPLDGIDIVTTTAPPNSSPAAADADAGRNVVIGGHVIGGSSNESIGSYSALSADLSHANSESSRRLADFLRSEADAMRALTKRLEATSIAENEADVAALRDMLGRKERLVQGLSAVAQAGAGAAEDEAAAAGGGGGDSNASSTRSTSLLVDAAVEASRKMAEVTAALDDAAEANDASSPSPGGGPIPSPVGKVGQQRGGSQPAGSTGRVSSARESKLQQQQESGGGGGGGDGSNNNANHHQTPNAAMMKGSKKSRGGSSSQKGSTKKKKKQQQQQQQGGGSPGLMLTAAEKLARAEREAGTFVKVENALPEDDDYVPVADYTRKSPSSSAKTSGSRSIVSEWGEGAFSPDSSHRSLSSSFRDAGESTSSSSVARYRAMRRKRSRRKKRMLIRIAIVVLAASAVAYYWKYYSSGSRSAAAREAALLAEEEERSRLAEVEAREREEARVRAEVEEEEARKVAEGERERILAEAEREKDRIIAAAEEKVAKKKKEEEEKGAAEKRRLKALKEKEEEESARRLAMEEEKKEETAKHELRAEREAADATDLRVGGSSSSKGVDPSDTTSRTTSTTATVGLHRPKHCLVPLAHIASAECRAHARSEPIFDVHDLTDMMLQ